jgi:hypothetical protein
MGNGRCGSTVLAYAETGLSPAYGLGKLWGTFTVCGEGVRGYDIPNAGY